ncbi:MAG TPA: AAA family ATPase [Solirubrobacteraceae bacterium]|nr:AAA family ATPase [Solirubrobacteraceae bacterium]
MKVVIPAGEAVSFGEELESDAYRSEERDYKVAVHLVLSALLSHATSSREDFPALIADVFREATPDLEALDLKGDDRAFITEALASVGGVRGAMANLAGGRWGLAQFMWIPRAVEFDLGDMIADAFRNLVDESAPVAERVDAFREQTYSASQALQQKGGYLPNWRLFRLSLSFVAMVLTGYDPSRYTFYSHGALRYGYDRYAPDSAWPKGSMGEIYAEMCELVKAVADELKTQGVPVRDLIDAQSFVWIRFYNAKEQEAPAKAEPSKPAARPLITESVAKDLATAAFWPQDRAERLVAQVGRWRQLLFQGPPGTGKTFIAETLARLLAGEEEGRVEVVQFHPSYAYEDFIEGIRPVVTEGSDLAYEVRKGIFLRLVDQAIEFPEDPFFLVVDELNRANLPRVFGELLYAVEYRGAEHTFRLPYSGGESYVPRNITIIATMNTADRSIALVDAAIRRRFRHIEFAPDPGVLRAWLGTRGLDAIAAHAVGRLVALNEQLDELLDPDRLIGHTYLMRDDLGDVGLEAVWEEDIEPVLREHLFTQHEEVARLRDVFLVPA